MTSNQFESAYRLGYDRTVRFLISTGALREDAQEAAQAAWARGWERLSQLRNDEMVLTWVNSIALNVHRRVRYRATRNEPLGEMCSGFEINLAAIDIRRLLRLCQPSERALLQGQMDGSTTEEMARHHGVTEAAIRIRLMRARRSARARVKPVLALRTKPA
jgi:DNA-directed RNA polymerase specialized sigma24 family protein